jgi:hypothetical protein
LIVPKEIHLMHLTIKLPDDLASELEHEAQRHGVDPQQYAARIIQENLPAAERAKALRELFAQWDAEDATDDPEELARRQKEWDQLRRALNSNRTSGRKLFPEE